MIAALKGRVWMLGDDHVVLDVHGVGYRVFLAERDLIALVTETEATLLIHTHVREDALLLYGFGTEADRDVFLALNTVTGIGPKVALGILAQATAADLHAAVVSGDLKRLTSFPGVGKKTAERIVVELKGRFAKMAPMPVPSKGAPTRLRDDVASALSNLGYKPAQIERAMSGVDALPAQPKDFDALLREALRHIR